MRRSPGFRFFSIGVLTLLMLIPLAFVSDIIDGRAGYSRQTTESVGYEWGGAQLISGPVLVVPVEARVTVRERLELTDPVTGEQLLDAHGNPRVTVREVEKTETRAPVYLYPGRYEATVDTATEERHRGIFRVPVYRADLKLDFDFPTDAVAGQLGEGETALWDQTRLRLHVGSNRGLRGETRIGAGETDFALEPLAEADGPVQGIEAQPGDPRDHRGFSATLGLNGAHSLMLTPPGRDSRVRIAGDWPHPSFTGAFLPERREIGADGFTAEWAIPHLARAIPQAAREDHEVTARRDTAFGMRFYRPNDLYQRAYRAARYGVMFIGLTFLTIFLIEFAREKPVHAVQYLLIGLAQAVFFVLLLALAEQIGFAPAYLVAAAATASLVTGFGAAALRLGRRGWLLFAAQAVLYTVLYLILRSADYALLGGALLAFAVIAGTMFATRNADWSGPSGAGGLLARFRRGPPETPQPPSEPGPV